MAKRLTRIGEHLTYAELRTEFAAAVARQDGATAGACASLLASCADGQHWARTQALLRLAGVL